MNVVIGRQYLAALVFALAFTIFPCLARQSIYRYALYVGLFALVAFPPLLTHLFAALALNFAIVCFSVSLSGVSISS